MKFIKRFGPFILVLLLLAFVAVSVFMVGPRQIIEIIGIKNAYAGLFLFAILGGVSTFTAGAFYTSIAVFTAGGLDPILVGVISGVGLTIGDSAFFYLGVQARDAFLYKYQKRIDKISDWLQNRRFAIPILTYLYTGFSPFPGDILMILLSMLHYPLRKAIIPVFLGNTTLALLLAFFGEKVLSIFGF